MASENPMLATIHELRELIDKKKLYLFLGEHTSSLVTVDNNKPSLDGWWDCVDFNDSKKTKTAIADLEKQYIATQPQKQSRIHNILRTVGTFPVILTTNLDHLLERYYWKSGADGDKIRIDQICKLPSDLNQLDDSSILIKCYGDTDLLTRITTESRESFDNVCRSESPDGDVTAQRVQDIFDSHSILFLGCDFENQIYKDLQNKFIVNSKRKHYMFQSSTTRYKEDHSHLVKIGADLQVWEFVQYLSTGGSAALQDIAAVKNQVIELSFLPTQREEYLKLQLHLEQHAIEIVFHTASVTNALATDELLDRNSRPSLEKIYRNDPFGVYSSEKVKASLRAMKDRRDNLLKIIDTNRNVKVVTVFLYEAAEAEVDPKKQKNEEVRRMALAKYAKVLLRAKSVLSTKSSLELRIVDGNEDDRRRLKKESFGIFKLNDGVDEASCFAQQALHDKALSHLIMFNGAEVTRHRRILESSIGKAWDAETSLLRLAALILQHNGHEEGNGAIDEKELNAISDMYDVQVITSRPDYDPRTLQFLGRGAFGEVYKVTDKSGKTYAIKMLKELETSDVNALEKFKRETESLSKVSHPNIVKLEEVMRAGHRLCIKLEFVDGGDLRKIIEPVDRQPNPQSKEFALRAAKQIGAALAYLHQNDLIHGDVKAENVMVTKDRSTFKLTDFGLTRNAPNDVTQTRTREGSMRYMAPEVAKETKFGSRKARYSNKADVYSYGLLMIEVISGTCIFEEYVDPKIVMSKKVEGTIDPRIPAGCLDKHGPIMVQVLTGCLKYQYRSRFSMQDVIKMLEGNEDALRGTRGVQLLCLGTGKGDTAAVYGEPSSSMVILFEGKPLLLVDMGLGIIKAYQSTLGDMFPKDIFITHNHTDHSGELALGGHIAITKNRQMNLPGIKLNILSGPEVLPKLRDHRMDEIYSEIPKENLKNFVEWTSCPEGERVYLDKDKTMYLISHKSQHSEICYGFNLYLKDQNILGFSADSGFKQAVYDKIFAASTVVVDARTESSKEHASFDEVVEFGEQLQNKPHQVYITGYGRQDEWSDEKNVAPAFPLTPGELYTLWPLPIKV